MIADLSAAQESLVAGARHMFVMHGDMAAGMAMITGDSETPVPFRHSMDIAAATVAADKDAKPQAVLQSSKSKLLSASFSFSSDSAHMTLPLNQDAEARTESHCRSPAAAVSTQRIPTISPIALPYGTPSQAPSPPTRKHSYTALPQQSPSTPQRAHSSASHRASPSGSFSSSVTPPQQPSSVAQSEVGSSASPARSSRTEVWRSNPAFSPRSRLENMVSGYRSSQSLPSCKGFIAVDRRLTDSWRAMLLEELEDESDTEQGADLRTTLPVVSEHTSLPALMEQWGMHSSHPTPQPALLHQQAPMHAQHTPELPAAHSPSPAQTTQSLVRSSTPLSSHAQRLETAFAQLPPAITSSHTLITHNTAPAGALLQSHVYQAQGTNGHHTWQAEQDTTSQAAKPWPQLQEAAQSRMAHTYHTAEDARPAPSNHGVPAAAPASLLIESNVELVKARSAMLDIPSAELLDSILDFANAVCGEAQLEAAGNHVEVRLCLPLLPAAPSGSFMQAPFRLYTYVAGASAHYHRPWTCFVTLGAVACIYIKLGYMQNTEKPVVLLLVLPAACCFDVMWLHKLHVGAGVSGSSSSMEQWCVKGSIRACKAAACKFKLHVPHVSCQLN